MIVDGDDDVTVTDQNGLTAEELALENKMRQDGDGDEADDGAPPPPAPKVNKAPKAPKQASNKQSAGNADGAEDGADGDAGGDGADGAPADGKNKMVPHAALHETREELKAARIALTKQQEAADATLAKAMDRFEKTLAAFAPKPPVPEPVVVPDFETDPAGWIAHTMTSTGKKLEEVEGELKTLREEKTAEKTRTDETSRNQAVVKEIFDYAIAKENEFKAATPDYDDASAFMLNSRKEELEELGYQPQQIAEMINIERVTIAHQAKQQGKNPAEIVYKLAGKRGYVKKAADAEPGASNDGKQQTDEAARLRLETARKGAEASASLSAARGNAPRPLTAAAILEMSDADFDRAANTPEGRALFGA